MTFAFRRDSDSLGISHRCGALWVAKDINIVHEDREVWFDWMDAQADLSLRWVHRSFCWFCHAPFQMDRIKRIWFLSPMRAAKVQASLRIRAISPEPSLLAHTSSESRGTIRQKARSLAPLNGWACAVEICHDGMLEDTNLLDRYFVRF